MEHVAAGAIPAWTLGDRLRKAREHARLKQSELAGQIGIARSSVVNYETGRHAPSRPVLLSWAMLCRVDFGWLSGQDDYRPVRQIHNAVKQRKLGNRALRLIRGGVAA